MSTKNLTFIDSRVANFQTLIASLSVDTSWVLLNAEEDGVLQMQRALSDHNNLDSIQVISHGSSGTLYLGSTVLNSSNLYSYGAQLQAVGSSLTASGDILLYGCNVGAGEIGQAFVSTLATISGADVAASNDPTGFNGNWILETSSGVVESQALSEPAYTGTLGVITGTDGNDTLPGTVADDIISGLLGDDVINGDAGLDVAVFSGDSAGYRLGLSEGYLQVIDINTADGDTGTDLLKGIETLRFADRDLAVSPDLLYLPLGQTRINSTTTGDQAAPSVTALSGGGYVVAWQSSNQDGSGYGIYAQRYDSGGAALGSETRINSTTTGDQTAPSVTALSGGGYVVTWQSNGIYAQRYDSGGAALGGETRISYQNDRQFSSAVTALSDGGYVVTWQSKDQDGSGHGIYAQRYDGGGAALGGEIQINSTTADQQIAPSVTALSGGGYVVTWQSHQGGGYDVYAQRYDSGGVALGGETWINSFRVGEQIAPSVTALSGGYFVTWQSYGQDGSGYGIYAQRYDIGGAALGSETRINSTTTDDQTAPSVTALSGGGYVVTWQSYNQDGSRYGIYAQRYDSGGAALGSETRINSTTTGEQSAPSVTALSGGGYVVTWQSYGLYSKLGDIYAQHFDAQGKAFKFEISGTPEADVINAGVGSQHLYGISGDDTLDGGLDSDVIDGGGGIDVAIFSGSSAGYRLGLSDGYLQVIDINTADGDTGTDLLKGIEMLRFADRDLAIGPESYLPLGETRINSTTTYDQIAPSVTALSGGGYVVAWQSNGQDGSGYGIYAQRYDSGGAPLGSETRINSTTTGDQTAPSVTALSGGGYVVTWQSNGQDGSSNGIYAQRYDSGGTALGAETRVNSATNYDQFAPSVTALNGGGYIVTWESNGQDESGYGVYAQRYGDGGVALGGEVRINSTTADQQLAPSVTVLSGGGYVVTWQSYNQDDSRYGIYAQRYDSGGAALGGEIRINSTTANQQIAPSVTALSGGGYVVTWQSYNQDSSRYGIYAQRYDSSGAALGGEAQINSFTVGEQIAPAVTALSGGGYIVTWQSYNQDGSGDGIYAQRYDSGGVALGGETRINSFTAGDQIAPSVTALSGGGYVVTWQSSAQDGSGFGIYAQRYDAEGQRYEAAGVEISGTASNDVINGGAGIQKLDGLEGNDTLDGGVGADIMAGGNGNDVYFVDDSGDLVIETSSSPSEIDTVYSSISYSLGFGLENLNLRGSGSIRGTGNELSNHLRGNAGANQLTGDAGNDTLNGGAGADTMIGGLGDDTYIVDNVADVISESIGGGVDTLIASVSYTLSDYQEHLYLAGIGAINGTGNELANEIKGNSANNLLNGMAGSDSMIGGLGNDTYIIDNTGDVVVEESALATEIDTVIASVSHILGANIENIWLTGVDAINATGNSIGNVLSGNADENILNGMAGVDTVTYEDAESRVEVSLSITGYQYTLGDGFDQLISIENLIGSTFNDKLSGDSLANRLYGGIGDDTLVGGAGNDVLVGGIGNDEMQGGLGNDTYYFANGDVIIETSNLPAEIDTVVTSTSYRLGTNLENLKLTGSANINATGNELNNVLYASAGNNILDGSTGTDTVSYAYGLGVTVSLALATAQPTIGSGRDILIAIENLTGSAYADELIGDSGNNTLTGGAGKDILTGGDGNDIFDFNTLGEMGTSSTTWDVITDFVQGQDKIDLSTLDANSATSANEAFNGTLLASGTVFTAAGQMKLVSGVLYGNTDADSMAEFAIQLTGITTLSSTDFIL